MMLITNENVQVSMKQIVKLTVYATRFKDSDGFEIRTFLSNKRFLIHNRRLQHIKNICILKYFQTYYHMIFDF